MTTPNSSDDGAVQSDIRTPRQPGCSVFEHELKVRPADMDGAGHLNHAAQVAFFEHGRVLAHAQVREARPEMPDMATAVRRLTVDYLGQCSLFDVLLVRSWVDGDAGSARTWEQELVRPDGVVMARARVVSVLVDLGSGRPMRLPDVYRKCFEAYTADS